MSICTYFPESEVFKSGSGQDYECNLNSVDHLFIAVALSKFNEGDWTLQQAYESIITNYNLECVKLDQRNF